MTEPSELEGRLRLFAEVMEEPEDIAFILACADALQASQERERVLREALVYALDGLEEMRSYVSDYFAEKWGHDEYIARTKAALASTPSEEK